MNQINDAGPAFATPQEHLQAARKILARKYCTATGVEIHDLADIMLCIGYAIVQQLELMQPKEPTP